MVGTVLGAKASDLQAAVVVGPKNPRLASLERPGGDAGARIELVAAADDMSALMDAADLAIVTGGSSVWELAYLGVPALVLTAGPQEELLAQGLKRERLFRVLGRTDTIDLGRLTDEIYNAMRDSDWRAETSRRGRELVDGNGADRVVQALKDLGGPSLA